MNYSVRKGGENALADHSENEVRKQRIREAFSDSKVVVEKMPAREDMTPELCAGTEIRVAPYCRVSTMSEQQAESYELQRQYYDEYINKHPEWTLVRIYADEGISATSTKKRKDFNAMIDDCRAGKIDLIVTKSISRFARNVVDCIEIARELKALPKPVGIYFQTENINTLTQNGELLLTVLAAFALLRLFLLSGKKSTHLLEASPLHGRKKRKKSRIIILSITAQGKQITR